MGSLSADKLVHRVKPGALQSPGTQHGTSSHVLCLEDLPLWNLLLSKSPSPCLYQWPGVLFHSRQQNRELLAREEPLGSHLNEVLGAVYLGS